MRIRITKRVLAVPYHCVIIFNIINNVYVSFAVFFLNQVEHFRSLNDKTSRVINLNNLIMFNNVLIFGF